ncbi:acyltransferase [Methylobacterium sp. WL120]|uniref:acyltransferase family protein n=1 Tax=Methylobacterium sp. WL120 TaxID=2603887 RepID=UPI001FEFF59A|nr:acyltransferase [Methylobacterium sp. WL120]
MKLIAIQILRAAAALLVVMHHAQSEAAALAQRTGQAFAPSALLPWAGGVDVFFVISGFIIVHAAAPHAAGPHGRRRFLAHRIARVVPLYWLVTALYLAVGMAAPAALSGAGGPLDAGSVVAAFLFWPAARADGAVQPVYGLGWTLNCEMAFYALFAVGLGWGRRPRVAWLVAALAGIVLAGAWLRPASVPLAFWSNPVMLEFAFGALIALARGEGLRLGQPARAALALLGLGLLWRAAQGSADLDGFWRPLALGIPAACLVAAAALGHARAEGGRRSSIVSALAALGDASYALYLVHPFALRALREVLVRANLAALLDPWAALALMLAASVAAALLVHAFVERPMTRLARARLDPAPDPSPKTV